MKVLIGVLALLLVIGVIVAVADPLGWRSSGGEGAEAAPGDATMYAEVNLDPGAGQQLEMVRFAMKFPGVRERLKLSEQKDLKQSLVESFLNSSKCTTVNYDTDVKPWLGDHAAVALRPGEKDPIMLIATSDEKKARAGWAKIAECTKGASAVAFGKDHLVVGGDQAAADGAVAAAKDNPLSRQQAFSSDLKRVGAAGLASFWITPDAVRELQSASGSGGPAADLSQFKSAAGTLRFSGGNPEIAVSTEATQALAQASPTAVGELPADTNLALGVGGGRQLVPTIMKAFDEAGLTAQLRQAGLRLPNDLETLLGDDFVLSAGALDVEQVARQGPEALQAGMSLKTDPAQLDELTGRLKRSGLDLKRTGTSPIHLSPSSAYAAKLASPGAKLKDQPDFTAAVPDPKNATQVVYVNLDAYKNQLRQMGAADDPRDLEPLRSIGVSNHRESDTVMRTEVRLVAH